MKAAVGISQCLLGDPVRYNGKDKFNPYLVEALRPYLDFHPLCPELAIGLGVPRNPIQLVVIEESVRLREVGNPQVDVTEQMRGLAERDSERLASLCGYIVMQESPSCGALAVKRYDPEGDLRDAVGQGIYIARLRELLPWLPIAEARDLQQAEALDNFLTRAFMLHDWQTTLPDAPAAAKLLAFHSRHKYLLMAHNPRAYRELGRALANLSSVDIGQFSRRYQIALLTALSHPATRGNQVNTLLHLKGYFREACTPAELQTMAEAISDYQAGRVPLSATIAALHAHVERTGNRYLAEQRYWQPYPGAAAMQERIFDEQGAG